MLEFLLILSLLSIVECFKPYIETPDDVGVDDDNEEKPKSIFEREDLFKDPLDEKE